MLFGSDHREIYCKGGGNESIILLIVEIVSLERASFLPVGTI